MIDLRPRKYFQITSKKPLAEILLIKQWVTEKNFAKNVAYIFLTTFVYKNTCGMMGWNMKIERKRMTDK